MDLVAAGACGVAGGSLGFALGAMLGGCAAEAAFGAEQGLCIDMAVVAGGLGGIALGGAGGAALGESLYENNHSSQ